MLTPITLAERVRYMQGGDQATFWLVNILEKPIEDKPGYKRALTNK